MKESKKFSLNWRDVTKGLLVAAGTSVAVFIQECLDKEEWVWDWKSVLMAAVGGGLTYLIKNFFQAPVNDKQGT